MIGPRATRKRISRSMPTARLNLLEATRRHCPAASFVFTSTNKVYGDRPNRAAFGRTGAALGVKPGTSVRGPWH